jgi:hypothetical protein
MVSFCHFSCENKKQRLIPLCLRHADLLGVVIALLWWFLILNLDFDSE